MSNYSKTTDFAAKDSLPSGDSGKIIRGSEFETEFDNISTAIATKADAADPTFTGTVTIDGLTVNGNTVLGNAATDTVTVTADIASNLIPSADDTYNLGASGAEWNDLYVDGVAYIDTIDGFATTGNITFGDNDKAIFGDDSDLEIYHGSLGTIVNHVGTSGVLSLNSDGSGVNIYSNNATALMAQFVAGGAANLFFNASQKLATTTTGVDVNGSITSDGIDTGIYAVEAGTVKITNAGNPRVELLHPTNSTDTYLESTSAGSIELRADVNNEGSSTYILGEIDGNTTFKSYNGGDFALYEDTGATEKLRWDASTERLGIGNTSPTTTLDVTGTVTADGLTVDGTVDINSSNPQLYMFESDSTDANTLLWGQGSVFRVVTVDDAESSFTQRFRVDHPTGDISFYEDTGTTAKFFWDASAESLGIGTSSPDALLEVAGTNNDALFNLTGAGNFELRATSGNGATANSSLYRLALEYVPSSFTNSFIDFYRGSAGNDGYLAFGSTGTERMRIDASGNLLVNGTSATGKLVVDGDANAYAVRFNSNTTTGQAFGARVRAGTNSSDYALFVENTSASSLFAVRGDGNVGIGTSSPDTLLELVGDDPVLTIRDSFTGSATANATLRLAETGASDSLDAYWDIKAVGGDLQFIDNWNEGGGTGTRLIIDDSGNVGIGTSDPQSPLHVQLSSARNLVVDFDTEGDSRTSLRSIDDTANNLRPIQIEGQEIVLGTAAFDQTVSVERMRIDSSGHLIVPNGVTLGTSVGTYAAANTLDDYEEGTWTPAAQNYEGTMTSNSATYTKIGNTVVLRCDLSFDSTSDGSGVNIIGLPFNHTGANKGNGGFCTKDTSGATEYITGEGSASILLYNDSYGSVTYTNVASGSIAFVYIYETTS